MKRYDVFISHTSDDKDAIARPLAEALTAAGLAVWYDEHTLTIGDNLRQSIDHGLAYSRFGIVILSKSFFAKKWPNWELDGLVQRQLDKPKIILPVWHNLAADDVKAYSPSLANILSVRSDQGLATVIEHILRSVRRPKHTGGAARKPTARLSSSMVGTPPVTRVVFEFPPPSVAVSELEKCLASSDPNASMAFVRNSPWALREFAHARGYICAFQPKILAPYGIDAILLSAPQGLRATLIKVASANISPFGEDGSWSPDLAAAVGAFIGWSRKVHRLDFDQALSELVHSVEENWPYRSGYDSAESLAEGFKNGHYELHCVFLGGRQSMIDAKARRGINGGSLKGPPIEVRTYDAILRDLFWHCPTVKFDDPVPLATFGAAGRDEEVALLTAAHVADSLPMLIDLVRKAIPSDKNIRLIEVHLSVLGDVPDGCNPHMSTGNRAAFKLGIAASSTWSDVFPGREFFFWHSPKSFFEYVSVPALDVRPVRVVYHSLGMTEDVDLSLVIAGARYCFTEQD